MKRLSNLKAKEVSLVKRGANKRPFLITKTADAAPSPDVPMSQKLLLTREQEASIDRMLSARAEAVRKDDEGLAPLDERCQAAIKATFRILTPFSSQLTLDDMDALVEALGIGDDDEDDDAGEDSIASDPATDAAEKSAAENPTEAVMAKGADEDEQVGKGAGKLAWQGDVPPGMDKDKMAKGLKAAQQAWKACMDGDTKKDADDEDEDMEKSAKKDDTDVAKSATLPDGIPAELRAYVEDIRKSADRANRALVEKSARNEAELRELRDERILKGHEEVIKDKFGSLGVDVSKTARLMKSLHETDKEAYDNYVETMRASAAQLRVNKSFGNAGLFGTQGTSPNGDAAQSGSASDRINRLVDQHVAKSGETDKYAAWQKVIKTDEGRELYIQSCIEERG